MGLFLNRWLISIFADHKDFGILCFIFGTFASVVGTLLSIFMRLQSTYFQKNNKLWTFVSTMCLGLPVTSANHKYIIISETTYNYIFLFLLLLFLHYIYFLARKSEELFDEEKEEEIPYLNLNIMCRIFNSLILVELMLWNCLYLIGPFLLFMICQWFWFMIYGGNPYSKLLLSDMKELWDLTWNFFKKNKIPFWKRILTLFGLVQYFLYTILGNSQGKFLLVRPMRRNFILVIVTFLFAHPFYTPTHTVYFIISSLVFINHIYVWWEHYSEI